MGSVGDSGVACLSRCGERIKLAVGCLATRGAAFGRRLCPAGAADFQIFSARARLTLTHLLAAWSHVVEPDQINVLASTMFRHLEQVQHAKESRLARQFRRNIGKPYGLNRIHLDLAFLHTVSRTYSDAGTKPESHTASDFSATYSLAKSFGERHKESLRPMAQCAQSVRLSKTCGKRRGCHLYPKPMDERMIRRGSAAK
jgi:hypothetical protein